MEVKMNIIQKPSNDYIKQATTKMMIVLHYTAGGTMAGAEATLAIKDYVNVHYGIDDDGTIHQYFNEKYWAYHTGTNKQDAMDSIGIEIRSWGHLTKKGSKFYSWTGKEIPSAKVIKLNKFRGFEYWERLTPQQIQAVKELILAIRQRHPITKVITHAMIKPTKLDFPPDYPDITDLLSG